MSAGRDTLVDLLERVKAATGADRELDLLMTNTFYLPAKGLHYRWGMQAMEPGSTGVAVLEAAVGEQYENPHYQQYILDRFPDESLISPEPFTDSVDAALALTDRVLGVDSKALCHSYDLNYHCYAHAEMAFTCVLHLASGDPAEMSDAHGQGASLPLAILAALLSALIAQPQPTGMDQ